jgi:hypothetical protein
MTAATHLKEVPRAGLVTAQPGCTSDLAIRLELGSHQTGAFSRFLDPGKARELAAALVECADHYDAETAKLGVAA